MRDDDDIHDKFNPGITEEQIRQAEKMLGGLNVPTFVEKRDLSNDFRAGILRSPEGTENHEVMISRAPIEGQGRHAVLSREPLPSMPQAQVSVRRLGDIVTRLGRVEESHPGRRAEDKVDGDLELAFFYPED